MGVRKVIQIEVASWNYRVMLNDGIFKQYLVKVAYDTDGLVIGVSTAGSYPIFPSDLKNEGGAGWHLEAWEKVKAALLKPPLESGRFPDVPTAKLLDGLYRP